jgi:hypothetical protein
VPLLCLRLVSPRLFHRRGRLFGFVGQAAFAFRDVGDFLRVLLQRLDATAFVDDLLAFVEQVFQVHDVPLLGGHCGRGHCEESRRIPTGALDCDAMAIQGGQNVVLYASPAVVVAIVGVVTEAELVKSSVVV